MLTITAENNATLHSLSLPELPLSHSVTSQPQGHCNLKKNGPPSLL